MERSASPVSLRTGGRRVAVACAVLAAVVTGLAAAAFVALAANPPDGSPLPVALGFAVLFAGVGAACARLAHRCATAGVSVGAEHVLILTRSGRRVPAWALTGEAAAPGTGSLHQAADELNRQLAAVRAQPFCESLVR